MNKLLTTLAVLLIATASYAQNYPTLVIDGKVVPIIGEFDYTIIYTTSADMDTQASLKKDCLSRGGNFYECGSSCPRWYICPAVCAIRCELQEYSEAFHIVERVVDGDTLKLTSGERVRLIGVDTPETVHPNKPVEYFGKEASAFTKKMCEGKKVYFEYGLEKRDKYDRLLAYVFLEDGTLVNAEIIKQGFGHVYTKFPFHRMGWFKKYELEARENKRGLWR